MQNALTQTNTYTNLLTVIEFLVPIDGFTLEECFVPEIIANVIVVDDSVQLGWVLQDGQWVSPLPPAIPTIFIVGPASGTIKGGVTVIIAGSNFQSNATVTIGGNPATSVTYVSDTTLTAVTPAGKSGAVSVIVTTTLGSNQANTLYTYTTP